MAYRLSRDAEDDLDEIWRYVAEESGTIDVAQNLVESISVRFDMLSAHPQLVGCAGRFAKGCVVIMLGIRSSFTESWTRTY